MKAPFRICLDSSRRRAVKPTDTAAAFLLCNSGEEVEKQYQESVAALVRATSPIIEVKSEATSLETKKNKKRRE